MLSFLEYWLPKGRFPPHIWGKGPLPSVPREKGIGWTHRDSCMLTTTPASLVLSCPLQQSLPFSFLMRLSSGPAHSTSDRLFLVLFMSTSPVFMHFHCVLLESTDEVVCRLFFTAHSKMLSKGRYMNCSCFMNWLSVWWADGQLSERLAVVPTS